MLRIENLRLTYGPIVAVHDVSLDVEQGEIVAIVGSNGAGKSSLLKGIAGLLLPSAGRITFEAQDISRVPPHLRVAGGIALSPEGRRVFADQTVRDNLVLGAYARRLDPSALAAEIDRQFELFPRLAQRRDQLAMTLSGGEQQMLAIGRALMASPRLLLLDEPSLGLAPKVVREIVGIVRRLRDRGITILLVEQMANLALAIADRGYVLETGRVSLSGTGQDLLRDPKVRAAYLG